MCICVQYKRTRYIHRDDDCIGDGYDAADAADDDDDDDEIDDDEDDDGHDNQIIIVTIYCYFYNIIVL